MSEKARRHGRSFALCVSLMLAAVCTPLSAQAVDDVHIWIRAFVPDGVTGFETLAEPLSAVPGAFFVRASDGACLATDHRGWTELATAPSRLRTDFHLVIDDNRAAALKPADHTTVTGAVAAIDCTTGAVLATTPSPLLADEVSAPLQADKVTQLAVLAATADPQRAWSSSTIHYNIRFSYDSQSHALEYQAATGAFPAYEAYATLNDGPVVTIFRSVPQRDEQSAGGMAKTQSTNADLQGSVNLSEVRRPKAPTGFTVQ
jgi:hypothetical protein